MMMTILSKPGIDRLDWETATKRAGPIVDLFGTDREGSYGVGDVFFVRWDTIWRIWSREMTSPAILRSTC